MISLLQGSRLAATAISISILYSRVWFCLPSEAASAISSPRAWVIGRRNRQCSRSSLSSDFDNVCHCEGKCAERGTRSRNGCRRSCRHRLCCGIRYSVFYLHYSLCNGNAGATYNFRKTKTKANKQTDNKRQSRRQGRIQKKKENRTLP